MNTHFATYITTHSLVRGTRTHIYIRTYTSTIVWVWWRDHQIMLIALSARPTTTTARQHCFGCFCCCRSCFCYCNSCIFFWLRLAFNSIHMHFMHEVTCTDTLTYKQTNVKFMCGGVTCFVITVSINTLRRSAQRPTADARTHTHALPKSHRHTPARTHEELQNGLRKVQNAVGGHDRGR